MDALQNPDNKGVSRKIVQDKELPGGLKGNLLFIIVRRMGEIFCKHLRCGWTRCAHGGRGFDL